MTAARLKIPSFPSVGVSLALSLEQIGESLELPSMRQGIADLETKQSHEISALQERVTALETNVQIWRPYAWLLACQFRNLNSPYRRVWEHCGINGPGDLVQQKASTLHKKTEAESKRLKIAPSERLAEKELIQLIELAESEVGNQQASS